MRSMGEGHPPVGAISWSCPVETLHQHSPPAGEPGGAPLPLRERVAQTYERAR
jgi:hypothetical protein